MTDLFWPGDERAGALFSPGRLLDAMVRVEAVWLDTLVSAGLFPQQAADSLDDLVSEADVEAVAAGAEAGGNPVIALLALLRERVTGRNPVTAQWLHRGLTSQDVLDTALMLCAQETTVQLRRELDLEIQALITLADAHRSTVMTGRTLTQPATATTFGLKAATWLDGLLDARDQLGPAGAGLSGQSGGAAGTLAAVTQLAAARGLTDPARTALDLATSATQSVGLASRTPWHTSRASVTRWADALVSCTDAWGRVANDVLLLGRPEIGELAEAAVTGRGGSSAMPHKANPVLSVLIRRAALSAPGVAAQLHVAAAASIDERSDGGWHAEWSALATLARHALTAGSQATELLTGLRIDPERMRANAESSATDLLAESRAVADWTDGASGRLTDHLGAVGPLIDTTLARARAREHP
ncbi:putative 3-carboxy-cis,cis-muconate cycloisomerase [metagenome]|uniref:Putative 3-carboxy-cis,cis-muconate cycloisomerase n=1 Tax=metagenome TaxID=256318 RepID=A0A2P2C9S1_9ZZZZ